MQVLVVRGWDHAKARTMLNFKKFNSVESHIADPGDISWHYLLVQSTSSMSLFPYLFSVTEILQSPYFSKTVYLWTCLSFPC